MTFLYKNIYYNHQPTVGWQNKKETLWRRLSSSPSWRLRQLQQWQAALPIPFTTAIPSTPVSRADSRSTSSVNSAKPETPWPSASSSISTAASWPSTWSTTTLTSRTRRTSSSSSDLAMPRTCLLVPAKRTAGNSRTNWLSSSMIRTWKRPCSSPVATACYSRWSTMRAMTSALLNNGDSPSRKAKVSRPTFLHSLSGERPRKISASLSRTKTATSSPLILTWTTWVSGNHCCSLAMSSIWLPAKFTTKPVRKSSSKDACRNLEKQTQGLPLRSGQRRNAATNGTNSY